MAWLLIPFLLITSALFSGLNLGIMSLTPQDLRRKAMHGNEAAKRIYPIRKQGNQLLTTVLLGNVAVNAILSVYLGSVTSGIVASGVATMLIFVFGEILPQAVFARHALKLSSTLAPVIKFFMIIFWPIARPISYVIDRLLGEEAPHKFSKGEIMSFISEQEDIVHGPIDEDEERIVHGALQFSNTTVRDVMTPRSVTMTVNHDDHLDTPFLRQLRHSGHSRFPVIGVDGLDNVIGILYLRDLVAVEFDSVMDACEKDFLTVNPKDRLDKVLNKILHHKLHMCIVQNEFGEFRGIITLEDIVEEVLQREIIDEDDRVEDMRQLAKQQAQE
jgi:metal transporter CNNM